MPPKPNGFYMFMLSEQKKMKALTNRAPSMREMPSICRDAWMRLSAEEKGRFEALSKNEKQKLQAGGVYAKLDCNRQVIADRKDPVKEENKRRSKERESLHAAWTEQDARDIVFHVLDFQVMYDDLMENHHFPLEIGLVSFTLRKGVINFMHRFIDPGEVPQGNRHLAVSYSDNSHKIPLHFEHSDANLKALTNHMTDFLRAGSDADELPPVFCLSVHRHLIENCLDFVYSRSFVSDMDRLERVYCLEDLVTCLISNSGKTEKNVAESQVFDLLRQNRWDYNSSIRCFYHDELDCSFCSLSIVRRYCFALFDILSNLLQFDLTDKHMPEEMEQNFIITQSFGFGRQNAKTDGDRRNRYDRFPPSNPPLGSRNESHSQRDNSNYWQPPKVQPVKIQLSEDEESEEEEKPKTTSDYGYKKLRLPKSMAQVQSMVGQMSLQQPDTQEVQKSTLASAAAPVNPNTNHNATQRFNPGVNATAPIRPMGRGMAPPRMASLQHQHRPVGQPAIRPPPGFGPRPSFAMPSPTTPATRPGAQAVQGTARDEMFPALSRGRGMFRGRGGSLTN